ncbi:v-SNARE [Komagataella phaffii CBS 7435]|uniref:Protein involved in cis-Golgi membrane traffic n=2 Tax=Komagataella phaffii TaxID=460519 RepID=C4R6G6_KOMPG|nr:Protein involved in cis-Golgi membrane traffic [Komagataella phaffii GS115]AOA64057.1 GQ67_04224T0 [Komagataella phaffii]CAH2449004.1 v-SNARE [Komagataella phaffii CBS 7435]AOA69384.1 GQ68_04196T0 [Komagataella phaffii GS115]CAY71152.1 Protein involved in cis-Golgi membrane traffic [Komagataella phaffii GS115]CCA39049.1 v-SNARE [Komagataella phaffii CBS 7435]
MSRLFETYSSDIQMTLAEAKRNLANISASNSVDRTRQIRLVEENLDDSYDLLERLNLELQNVSTSDRTKYNVTLRDYQNTLTQLKEQLIQRIDEQDRNHLFQGSSFGSDADDNLSYTQRQQLLKSNASLERSSDRLRETSRIALETEDIGAGILNDLRSQREQIVNSRNTLLQADGYVDRSIQTLRTMTRRMATNKIISYAIIGVLIILIALVLVSKFY